jgi:hypothetical protein
MCGHWRAGRNVFGAKTLALPATFVVDQSGTIRLAYINEDYAERLSTDVALVALEMLSR